MTIEHNYYDIFFLVLHILIWNWLDHQGNITRLISIESQPKKILVVVVIGVVVVVVHVVAVVIPVVDTRNIPNKVWLKPGY